MTPTNTPPWFVFVVPGQPRPKARGRAVRDRRGRTRIITPVKTRVYESQVAQRAAFAAKGRKLSGPVRVEIYCVRKRPKTPGPRHECRAGIDDAHGRKWCTTVPDVDNITKAILDGMNGGGVWLDDRQVVAANIRKVWGHPDEAAHVRVAAYDLTNDPQEPSA